MTACLSAATFGSTGVDVRPLQGILTEQSCSQTAIFMHLQKKTVSLEAQKSYQKSYQFLSTFKFGTLKLLALSSDKKSCQGQTIFIN